jgi:GTP-binding protein EngB required for normal cell division
MKISVVGKVSVGKSSFINTFHYLINDKFGFSEWSPVTSISAKKETFQPINLIFSVKQDPYVYEEEIKKNGLLRLKKPADFSYIDRHIMPDNGKIEKIVDFPGFDDSKALHQCIGEGGGEVEEILKNMGDLTIFVTDAARAFVDKSELEVFNRILKKSEDLGAKNEVIILVNKFDHLDQEELNEIFVELPAGVKKFRWCSYAVLKNNLMRDNNCAKLVTAPCDIDGLMDYIFQSAEPKPDFNEISVLDFIPPVLVEKLGAANGISTLRLIYKFLEKSDLKTELEKLTKIEVGIIAKNLLVHSADKSIMIAQIVEKKSLNDKFRDIFRGCEGVKIIREKLGITVGFFEYYRFFGLGALENWTVPYLQILARSLKIKVVGKKKSELLSAIFKVAYA